MDQLKQFIAENDRTRRGREVLSDLEGAGVDHRRHATILDEVVKIVLQSLPQALAAGIDELAHRRRIGQHRVGGRHRIDQDFRDQMRARLVNLAEACFVDEPADRLAPGKVSLEQSAVQPALLPCRIGKPFVAGLRRALGFATRDGS